MTPPLTPTPTGPAFDPDDDDRMIGRVLSRREVLALMGAASVTVVAAACAPGSSASGTASASGAAPSATAAGTATASVAAVASSLPSCVVVPELTEGPYYVNENLDRSDIRTDTSDGTVSEGAVLTIDWVVSQVDGNACIPLEGVLVDVWHCDALGVYSDVSGAGAGKKFLRGNQTTDATGVARFTTVFPGWYQGRAVHIHFKMRSDAVASSGHEFTSQLFFDEATTARIFAAAPYSQKGSGWLKNDADGIYQGGGSQLLLTPTGDAGTGLGATFEVGLRVA
jgi:protocatechuate 3,4-dioxygenase beta subunit